MQVSLPSPPASSTGSPPISNRRPSSSVYKLAVGALLFSNSSNSAEASMDALYQHAVTYHECLNKVTDLQLPQAAGWELCKKLNTVGLLTRVKQQDESQVCTKEGACEKPDEYCKVGFAVSNVQPDTWGIPSYYKLRKAQQKVLKYVSYFPPDLKMVGSAEWARPNSKLSHRIFIFDEKKLIDTSIIKKWHKMSKKREAHTLDQSITFFKKHLAFGQLSCISKRDSFVFSYLAASSEMEPEMLQGFHNGIKEYCPEELLDSSGDPNRIAIMDLTPHAARMELFIGKEGDFTPVPPEYSILHVTYVDSKQASLS